MLEPREIQGYWWLPFMPDGKIPGTLHFSQADIKLELLGGFARPFEETRPEESEEGEQPREVVVSLDSFIEYQPRISGVAQNGKPITLERCTGRSLQLGFPQFGSSTYGPHFVLVGAEYAPDEEVAFDEIAIRLSDLDVWASTSGFGQQMIFDDSRTNVERLEMTFTPPDDVEAKLGEGTTLKISFPWTWSGQRPITTESHIVQTATLRLLFDEPANIEQSLTYVAQLRNFLSLAVSRPIRMLSVKGLHNPLPDAEPDRFTGTRPRPIDVEILYRLVGLPEPAARELHPTEMLFTLADIAPRLGEILSNWFAKQELLGPVLARYFHLIHTSPSSREHEFESLVRVLETHHRRTHGAAAVTPEHRERLGSILSAVAEVHREWLEKKLKYSHEPTLPERLMDVLDRCPSVTARVVGDSKKKRKSFIRKVTSTRNYEVHLDPTGQAAAAQGARLLTLIKQLRPLVEMTLLLELGFSCDEVAALFEREGSRYQEIEHFRGLR
jgi:hypothetical protein